MIAEPQRHAVPVLDSPVLVVLLDGWVDAGRTLDRLAQVLIGPASVLVASFDADALVDHRNRRPMMHIDDGVNSGIDWPCIELVAVRDLDGRDVVVLRGPEPDRGWRAFSESVVGLARELAVRMVVSLGAYPAATAHTRPVTLSGIGTTPALVQRVGYLEGKLDVPAGIHGAIERTCAAQGVPAVGLWAPVPHYVATEAFPAATVALLDGLERIADRRFATTALRHEAMSVSARLDAVIRADGERSALVANLETHIDTVAHGHPADLPTGDELATLLEQYLDDNDSGDTA